MSIKSIRIVNILSFEDSIISDFADFNCIIGKNNVGKSNFLKTLQFFYAQLNNEKVVHPSFNSNYSSSGTITITYDTTKLESVIRSNKSKSNYQKHIYSSLFKDDLPLLAKNITRGEYKLTLTISRDGSINWSEKDIRVRKILYRIYPLFHIDTRRIDLYDWEQLWMTVSQLKFLNTKELKTEQIVDFIDEKVSSNSSSYKEYVEIIGELTKASPYDYQDLILNYIKVGLKGHTFNINGNSLNSQSDGTNSHKFIELFISLIITLTRREFITPIVFIDEPELGLHPKLNEQLFNNIYKIYKSLKKSEEQKRLKKYSTPNPKIIVTTHSPNILKTIIKLFKDEGEHTVQHFTFKNNKTKITKLNTTFEDKRFLNIFGDTEARLYFSEFILFVEGETELELFGNLNLISHFPCLSRVDVSKVNEVMLKALSPRTSNASIPFLTLYDADKMLSYSGDDHTLSLLEKEVNLHKIYKRYKLKTYFSKDYRTKVDLKRLLSIHESQLTPSNNGITYDKFNYRKFIDDCNKILIKSDRIYLPHSTIEELLVSEHSLELMYEWLYSNAKKLNGDVLKIDGKGDINKKLDGFRARFSMSKIFFIFRNIFTDKEYNGQISDENKKFVNFVFRRYMLALAKEYSVFSDIEKATILRLALNGKTHTLCSTSSTHYEVVVSEGIRKAVDELKSNCLSKLPIQVGKTGGWVTSFLDYSIEKIEKSVDEENSFEHLFACKFPALSVILKEISNSID